MPFHQARPSVLQDDKANVRRASETPEQTVTRQKQNRIYMVSVRASETAEQTVTR